MGKEKQFPKGKGVPKVERDGFTMPSHPIGDMHIDHLGGHQIHPARLQRPDWHEPIIKDMMALRDARSDKNMGRKRFP